MRKEYLPLASILMATLLFTSCASTLPVNSYYEKAGTLKKGGVEISGSATRYSVSHFDRTEFNSQGGGFRAGYGVSERFDLKLRYEKQKVSTNFDGRLREYNMISLVPKYALLPGRISIMLPVSRFSNKNQSYDTRYSEKYTSVSPVLLFTLTDRKKLADVTMGLKSDFLFGTEESTWYGGGFIGAGFSTNLDKWSIRPEIGFSRSSSNETFWNYGVGLQFAISRRK